MPDSDLPKPPSAPVTKAEIDRVGDEITDLEKQYVKPEHVLKMSPTGNRSGPGKRSQSVGYDMPVSQRQATCGPAPSSVHGLCGNVDR